MERRVSIVSLGLIAAAMVAVTACTHAPVASQPASAAESAAARVEHQARVPGEYLITLASGVDEGVISEYYGRFGIKDVNALGEETFLLVLSNDPGPQEMVGLVRDDPRIEAVQPNLIYWTNRSGKIKK
jgi:hypothetical protein